MNCFLFGAGEYTHLPLSPTKEDFVIAVDGGLSHMKKEGLCPSLWIGDFDSHTLPETPPCPILTFPKEKDDTDMRLAIQLGLEKGADTFLLFGGMGGRTDHTFANFACLAELARMGKRGYLFGADTVCTVIQSQSLSLPDDLPCKIGSGTVSVFAFGSDAEGVTIQGLKYETDHVTLHPFDSVGVSNDYTAPSKASIEVENGALLLFLPLEK